MKIGRNFSDFKLVLIFHLPFFHFLMKKERGINHSPRAPSNGCWHLYRTLVCIKVMILKAETITTDANMTVV